MNSPSKQNHPGVGIGVGGGIGSGSPGNSANQAASNWIYPPAFYHPRLVPSYQHHGSFIHPAAPATVSIYWKPYKKMPFLGRLPQLLLLYFILKLFVFLKIVFERSSIEEGAFWIYKKVAS